MSAESSESGRNRESSCLQPLELPLGPVEGGIALGARFGVQEQFDLGAHGMEGAALHHEVLVIVSGGRVTTRTEGAAPVAPLPARTRGACCRPGVAREHAICLRTASGLGRGHARLLDRERFGRAWLPQ